MKTKDEICNETMRKESECNWKCLDSKKSYCKKVERKYQAQKAKKKR